MNTLLHFDSVEDCLSYAGSELIQTLEQEHLTMKNREFDYYTDEDRQEMTNKIQDLKMVEPLMGLAYKFHQFIQEVAEITKDGEETEFGEDFDMPNDFALDTLHNLIDTARSLVLTTVPDRNTKTTEPDTNNRFDGFGLPIPRTHPKMPRKKRSI